MVIQEVEEVSDEEQNVCLFIGVSINNLVLWNISYRS